MIGNWLKRHPAVSGRGTSEKSYNGGESSITLTSSDNKDD